MRKSYLKRSSLRATARANQSRPIRERLIAERGECDICGCSPAHPHRGRPAECSRLCCHEIANGPNRQKALDKPFAILVLCWFCNGSEVEDKAKWPQARQLALLQRVAPQHYDLAAFNALIGRGPNRITQEDVDECDSC